MTYNVSAGKYEALEKENERLRERERELCAQVERLRGPLRGILQYTNGVNSSADVEDLERYERDANSALNETPAQSLREIRAEAGREGFVAAANTLSVIGTAQEIRYFADQYANQVREGKE